MADVWYGVETQKSLHIKTLSFTKEEVSLTLSLSLFTKQREEQGRQQRKRFHHRVVVVEKAIKKCKSKERKEDLELDIYPRGNVSVRASLEDEKRGRCREEEENTTTTTDRC
jgi:predicted acetyltransferase